MTTEVRSILRANLDEFLDKGAKLLASWVIDGGELDLERANVYLRALEFKVPKLGRTELTSADGGPLQVSINIGPARGAGE